MIHPNNKRSRPRHPADDSARIGEIGFRLRRLAELAQDLQRAGSSRAAACVEAYRQILEQERGST